MKQSAAVLAVGAACTLGACGGGDDKSSSSTAAGKQQSPSNALPEIAATRKGLDRSLAQLRRRNRAAASNTVAETYVQHFEHVEEPLGKVDAKLKEKLEEGISTDLRGKIKSGAPVPQVAALVNRLKADLKVAEGKLK
jgi:DNA anti-recombination protein RmuC